MTISSNNSNNKENLQTQINELSLQVQRLFQSEKSLVASKAQLRTQHRRIEQLNKFSLAAFSAKSPEEVMIAYIQTFAEVSPVDVGAILIPYGGGWIITHSYFGFSKKVEKYTGTHKFIDATTPRHTKPQICLEHLDKIKDPVINVLGLLLEEQEEPLSSEQVSITIAPFFDSEKRCRFIALTAAEVKLTNTTGDTKKALNQSDSEFFSLLNNHCQAASISKFMQAELELLVEDRTQSIQSILKHITQGIMTFDDSGNIYPEFSKYVHGLLQSDEIHGKNIYELIFSNSNVGEDTVDQVSTSLSYIFYEDRLTFELNEANLPRAITRFVNNKEQHLELDWQPILNDDGNIGKMMLVVRDVTSMKQLEKATKKQEEKVQMIHQILLYGFQSSRQFLDNAFKQLDGCDSVLHNHTLSYKQMIESLAGTTHTLKGATRSANFEFARDIIHITESTLTDCLHDRNTDHTAHIANLLNQIRYVFEQYQALYIELATEQSTSENELIGQQVSGLMTEEHSLSVEEKAAIYDKIHQSIHAMQAVTLEKLISEEISLVSMTAKTLNKPEPRILIEDNGIKFDKSKCHFLRYVFLHCFNNAIDHGLEDQNERASAGKPETGLISVVVENTNDECMILIQDDGRGLNLPALKEKGWRHEHLNEDSTDEDIAETIFQYTMTTKDAVSDVSGRGIGMGAVRSHMNRNGGHVNVRLLADKESSQGTPFQIVIHLPSETVVQ